MTDTLMDVKTLEVDATQLQTLIDGLENTMYWTSDRRYRRDAQVDAPYSDDPEVADRIHAASNLCGKLLEMQAERDDGKYDEDA